MRYLKDIKRVINIICDDIKIINSTERIKAQITKGNTIPRNIDLVSIKELDDIKVRYRAITLLYLDNLKRTITNDFNIILDDNIDFDMHDRNMNIKTIPSILQTIVDARNANDNKIFIESNIRQLAEILYIYRLQVSNM